METQRDVDETMRPLKRHTHVRPRSEDASTAFLPSNKLSELHGHQGSEEPAILRRMSISHSPGLLNVLPSLLLAFSVLAPFQFLWTLWPCVACSDAK